MIEIGKDINFRANDEYFMWLLLIHSEFDTNVPAYARIDCHEEILLHRMDEQNNAGSSTVC